MKKKHINVLFNQMNLMQKLLASYLLFIIVPMLLLIFLSYAHISEKLIQQFEYSSNLALQQTDIYISKVLNEIENSTDQISFNPTLTAILQEDTSDASAVDIYKNYLTAFNLIRGAFTSDVLYSVEIFINGDSLYISPNSKAEKGISFITLNNRYAREIDKELSKYHGKILYLAPRMLKSKTCVTDIPIITGARYIKAPTNYTTLGILTVNIQQEMLNSIIKNACILPNSISLLLNQNGTVMAVSEIQLLKTHAIPSNIILKCVAENKRSFSYNGETMLINSTTITPTGWTLVSLIPYQEMLKNSISTRNNMLVIFFIISSLFFITAYFISRSITARVRFLAKRMKEIQFDNYTPISNITGNDEIGDLTHSYNFMLKKINDYAESQYQLGITLKNTELKALQAQINPHFLYNTLDLLHWLADDYGADEISEIVTLLSNFYKLGLSKGIDVVSIKDAIQQLEVYVKLQNFRFGDSINLEIHLSPKIYELSILKLLLQPIVENSIIHGILEKKQPSGTISIEGYITNNNLYILISDNGIGMTNEQINQITNPSHSTVTSGYGISNVIERIKLYYGNQYGLTYESQLGQGTSVLVKIPSIKFNNTRDD